MFEFFSRPNGPDNLGNGCTKTTRFLESNLAPGMGAIATVTVATLARGHKPYSDKKG
jgi:hypothetical protein